MYAPFADTPAIVFTATGICCLLHVDLLARVLSDVPDKHPAGLAVEAVPKWIAQSERPDFSARTAHADEWIVRWDGGGPGRGINMNAEHFAEQGREILRVAARLDVTGSLIVASAAVSGCDIQIVCVARSRTEADPSTVVIGFRMIEGDQDSLAVWLRNVRISSDRELLNVRYPVSESAAGNGEVEIKLSIRRVIRIEGHPKQTLLASGVSQSGYGEERCRVECTGEEIQNPNIPVLLHDK